MVVGYLAGVEHLLALGQLLAGYRLHQRAVLRQSVEYGGTLGVYVVRQVLGVYTWVGGELLLIEGLDDVEGHLGRVAELLVTVNLQRCEVIEVRGRLRAFLLLYAGYREGLVGYGGKRLLALLLAGELALRGSELRVAVDGGQHPVGFRLKMVYLFLPVHYQRQRGGLYTAYAQHLTVLAVLEGVQAGGVHAQ